MKRWHLFYVQGRMSTFKGLLSLAVAVFLLITAYQAWEYYFRVD